MKKFYKICQISSIAMFALGALGSWIIADAVSSWHSFNYTVFFTCLVSVAILCMIIYAIGEHLKNQEIMQQQLEAMAYELHEINKSKREAPKE